jgi:hypothetical protein
VLFVVLLFADVSSTLNFVSRFERERDGERDEKLGNTNHSLYANIDLRGFAYPMIFRYANSPQL